MRKISVGIVGFGTVGSGVVKVLKSKRAFLKEKTGVDIVVRRICDKDLKTKRPVAVDKKLFTRFIGEVLYDPKIDIIVELIGGMTPARDIVLGALKAGKHVVTANKALLSQSGYDILKLANTLGLSVGFEASVGGGVPIIRALKEAFAANRIDLVYGIINGTSNFILSKMADEKIDFKEALSLAQANGYAEMDPRLDISGGDSAHKLSILALLGFGIPVRPGQIYTEGIVDIEPIDIQYAAESDYAIKLLAIAKRAGDLVELRVHPTLIPKSHLLSGVNGVYNAIFVKGDLIGENLFYGEGAGAMPTASAVVGDIIDIAKNMSRGCCFQKTDLPFRKDVKSVKKMDEVRTRFYIRFSAIDKPGVLARIANVLARYRISIASVTQKERKAQKIVPIIMMTHEAIERDMAQAIRQIDALPMIKKKSVRVRIEG